MSETESEHGERRRLTQDGEMIEGIEGDQGAQLIVFGDPNSKRAVRYMKTVSIGE